MLELGAGFRVEKAPRVCECNPIDHPIPSETSAHTPECLSLQQVHCGPMFWRCRQLCNAQSRAAPVAVLYRHCAGATVGSFSTSIERLSGSTCGTIPSR
jgi:hypothetical protein